MSVELLLGKRPSPVKSTVDTLATKASTMLSSRVLSDRSLSSLAVSTEGMDESQTVVLGNAYSSMETAVRTMCTDMGLAVEDYQVTAATIAGLMAADPTAVAGTKLRPLAAEGIMLNPGVSGGVLERMSLEAYDERDNRNAQMHSVVYSLMTSRQDEFAETLFPTIVCSPNEMGLTVALKFFYVYNDFKRQASGALANYNRQNVMRAYKNVEILKNELTRAVPVLRKGGEDKNDDRFVDTAVAPSWTESLGGGISVETGWVKTDVKFDLIAMSQTNELLASGVMGPSDSLDTYLRLNSVLVRVTDGTDTDLIAIDLSNNPMATFTFAPTGNYRKMMLAMDTDSVVLGRKTKALNGSDLTLLDELATHDARVHLNINGNVILDKGDAIINRGTLELTTLRNASGQLITGSVFKTLADKIASAEIIGFKLDAWRANSNLRQRGQLMDTQLEYRSIPVYYRSPMGVIAPANRSQNDDSQPLSTLISATGTRMSNEAVLTLRRWESAMEAYQSVADASGTLPEMSAIGSAYLIPTFMREQVKLELTVDSLKSSDRFGDIRAAIAEKIRWMANELNRRSEYGPVSAVLTNNPGFKPTVIVATDPVIHNYLTKDGDLRLLGDSFDVKVVSTIAQPIENKIYITFGVFDQQRNTTLNPLNSGNMLYTPEMVLNLPITRDGQVSNELTVTPRFVHIWNLPVLGVLDVTGLPAVTSKQAVHTKEVI